MTDSVEAFVQKLQAEGVDAGRAEATRIVEQAKAQAEKIAADAEAEAERIREQARGEAQRTVEQGGAELQLASRDVLLRLRETIVGVLEAILYGAAEEALNDDEFLRTLLHDISVQYAKTDATRDGPVEVHVSDDKLKVVTDWAIQEMKRRGVDESASHIDLRGRLMSAGFEYNATGGTVEVTPESVAAVLGEMLSPRLREMIDRVAAEKGQ
jgi:V/A-type H+-transporting ATPase subunit E